jgi:hypothetical protein
LAADRLIEGGKAMIVRLPALYPGTLTLTERRRLALCLRDALLELVPDIDVRWTTRDRVIVERASDAERAAFARAYDQALAVALERFYAQQDVVQRTGSDDLVDDHYVRRERERIEHARERATPEYRRLVRYCQKMGWL